MVEISGVGLQPAPILQFNEMPTKRKPRMPTKIRPLVSVTQATPPPSLSDAELEVWQNEFSRVPAGVLLPQDVPAMVDLVRTVIEERKAFAYMVASNRSRDASGHWRSCKALVLSSRRSLRLTPQQRLPPRRAGLLTEGVQRNDPDAFQPPTGKHNWRDLFPTTHQ